jgi:four helix bundle protein
MTRARHTPIEEMEVFRRYVSVADWVWDEVVKWAPLAADTVGKQLVRAMDSVGANLVEGDGRHGSQDALRFFIVARASAREARYWLNRAMVRSLIGEREGKAKIAEIVGATQLLNRLIAYRRGIVQADRVREESELTYLVDSQLLLSEDPFTFLGEEMGDYLPQDLVTA